MDNFRRMNISYRNNGHIIIHHSDSSKTNLNHFPTNSELIPSIIHEHTCMQVTNLVFETLTSEALSFTRWTKRLQETAPARAESTVTSNIVLEK